MENKTFAFKKYQGVLLKLTKIEDRRFLNDHPNGYNLGHVETGILHLEMSNKYQCIFLLDGPDRYYHTSQVLEIEEHERYDYIKTLNSVYKLEPRIMSITGVQEKYPIKVDTEEQSS